MRGKKEGQLMEHNSQLSPSQSYFFFFCFFFLALGPFINNTAIWWQEGASALNAPHSGFELLRWWFLSRY